MNHKWEIEQEIKALKDKLRERERERAELWSGAFWWWILFWPVLVYKCVKKSNKGARLDMEIRDLREQIQSLEREAWEEKKNKT
jgi:hypothetical protein